MNTASLPTRHSPHLEKSSRRHAIERAGATTRLLLLAGALSSLAYALADLISGLSYQGYSFAVHTVSELSAVGAPSRALAIPLFLVFSVLVTAFGFGVWRTAGERRALRIAGALVVVYGISCMTAGLTPMHTREVIAAGGATVTDTLHIAATIVEVVLIILIIAFSASAFGWGFRVYSFATVATMIVFGLMTSADASRLEANLPTPYAGLYERVNIYAFLLWFVVLAIALRRRVRADESSWHGANDPLNRISEVSR